MRPEHPLPIDSLFDAGFADRLARFETYNKHHYRPNTYLHKWWGRRCGSTFRLILKGLVEDEVRRPYYASGGLEGKVILDPMMGGGTTLHEAIRLGASVMGVDVDPIPVMQARATMTEMPVGKLREGFGRFYEALHTAVGSLYRTHCPQCDEPAPLWHALYGLRRDCGCGEALVVDSLTIRHEPDGTVLRWCPSCGEICNGGSHTCRADGVRLVEKGCDTCETCGQTFSEDNERRYFARYVMLAVAGHCQQHGLFHKSPDWRDEAALRAADARRDGLSLDPEAFCVEAGDKSVQLGRRNIPSYLDLFSSRQLLFLEKAISQLAEFEPPMRLNLALLVSTSLEFNSMLCGYKGVNKRRAGAVRHTFSHHGYSFPYTALENNPLYPRRASGTLQKLFYSRLERGRRWAAAPRERRFVDGKSHFVTITGERDAGTEVGSVAELRDGPQRFFLMQGSSAHLPIESGTVDAVVTDPPYFDSIQYGDLSAFFRVWLDQFLPGEADWRYDESAAAVNSERAPENSQYVEMMSGILAECRRVLVPESGRLIFTFHHWQPRAWAALCIPLYRAGFALRARYVVHAEHPMSVHISKMRALTHDAILVFVGRGTNGRPRWERPATVDATDSYRFTESCATFLGWVLEQPGLSAADIEQLWATELMAGDSMTAAEPLNVLQL